MNFENTLDAVSSLSMEQQITLLSIVQNRLIEQRRNEIELNAKEAIEDFNAGKLKSYEVGELLEILDKHLEYNSND